MSQDKVVRYSPAAFYFRRSLRRSSDREQIRAIGLALCAELERHREFIRSMGVIPPRWIRDPEDPRATTLRDGAAHSG